MNASVEQGSTEDGACPRIGGGHHPAGRRPAAGAPAPARRDLSAELLVAWVVDHSDVLAPVPAGLGRKMVRQAHYEPMRWLLLPIPERLLLRLELVDADREDLEDGADAEPDADREFGYAQNVDQTNLALGRGDDDAEDDGLEEPSIVRPEGMDRSEIEHCAHESLVAGDTGLFDHPQLGRFHRL